MIGGLLPERSPDARSWRRIAGAQLDFDHVNAANHSPGAPTRANETWKATLADYQAPVLDVAVDEALQAFMAKRKESTPDAFV